MSAEFKNRSKSLTPKDTYGIIKKDLDKKAEKDDKYNNLLDKVDKIADYIWDWDDKKRGV